MQANCKSHKTRNFQKLYRVRYNPRYRTNITQTTEGVEFSFGIGIIQIFGLVLPNASRFATVCQRLKGIIYGGQSRTGALNLCQCTLGSTLVEQVPHSWPIVLINGSTLLWWSIYSCYSERPTDDDKVLLIVIPPFSRTHSPVCLHFNRILEEGSEDLLSCIDYAERVRQSCREINVFYARRSELPWMVCV